MIWRGVTGVIVFIVTAVSLEAAPKLADISEWPLKSPIEELSQPTNGVGDQDPTCGRVCRDFYCGPIYLNKNPWDLGPLESKKLLEECVENISKQQGVWFHSNPCKPNCDLGLQSFPEKELIIEPESTTGGRCQAEGAARALTSFSSHYSALGCDMAALDVYNEMRAHLEDQARYCLDGGCGSQITIDSWFTSRTKHSIGCTVNGSMHGTITCTGSASITRWKLTRRDKYCIDCRDP